MDLGRPSRIGLGGWGVIKFGVARCLVIATILIASTNLFFAAMVIVGPEPWMLAVTISADNMAQGFSGTVLIAYLSSLTTCHLQQRSTRCLVHLCLPRQTHGRVIPAMCRSRSAG